MTAEPAQLRPVSAPKPLPVPHPSRATRVDWGRVVELLSQGFSSDEVARRVGCSRQHVWNVLRKSRAVQAALDEAENQIGLDANLRLRGLRPDVANAIASELSKGNVRVMLWLADRLHLTDPWRSRGGPRVGDTDADAVRATAYGAAPSVDDIAVDAVDAPSDSTACPLTVNPGG
jgi:hypothetical protein